MLDIGLLTFFLQFAIKADIQKGIPDNKFHTSFPLSPLDVVVMEAAMLVLEQNLSRVHGGRLNAL